MYIHDSINFKSYESLWIELISRNPKSTILSTTFRPPDGDFKAFNIFLEDIYSISLKSNKLFCAAGDFNLNFLDYNKNKNEKVMKFLDWTFEYGLVPVINKPTRVTKNTATTINHITANSLLQRTMSTGIIKLDISDHFPIFLIAETERRMTPEGKVQITIRLINNKSKEKF